MVFIFIALRGNKQPVSSDQVTGKDGYAAFVRGRSVELPPPPPPPPRQERKHTAGFKPSHEWQVVEEGQVLPPGLHIQMDLQTGKKMAKLMEQQVGVKLVSEMRRDNLQKYIALAKDNIFPTAECETSKGDVTIELRFDWGQHGAERLLELINDEFFTNNVFYRVLNTSLLALLKGVFEKMPTSV